MHCMLSAYERGITANALQNSADCSTSGAHPGMLSSCAAQRLRPTITSMPVPATDAQLESRAHDSIALPPDPSLGGGGIGKLRLRSLHRGRSVYEGPSHLRLHALAEERGN